MYRRKNPQFRQYPSAPHCAQWIIGHTAPKVLRTHFYVVMESVSASAWSVPDPDVHSEYCYFVRCYKREINSQFRLVPVVNVTGACRQGNK